MIDEENLKEIEENKKNKIFEMTRNMISKHNIKTQEINNILKKIGINHKIDNIGITFNNKLVEILHKFNNAGISMFIQKNEIYENSYEKATSSFAGFAIIEDLLKKVRDGEQSLKNFENSFNQITIKIIKENEKINKIKQKNKKGIHNKNQQIKIWYSEEDKKTIINSLSYYENKNKQIYNYTLKDNIVESLINYIIEYEVPVKTAVLLMNSYVFPDLEKLGVIDEELVKNLKEDLTKKYVDYYKKFYYQNKNDIESEQVQDFDENGDER